jgi:hypothetical protein
MMHIEEAHKIAMFATACSFAITICPIANCGPDARIARITRSDPLKALPSIPPTFHPGLAEVVESIVVTLKLI